MLQRLKLSHHSESGRLKPHESTSYLPLFILLLVVGLALTASTIVTAQSPGPEAGSVSLTGAMPGKPPTTAATITSPFNGQHFSTSPVTVSGTCPKGTLVEIFKNDIFAGSTPCLDNGTFSLQIDLLIGPNRLVARVYDSLNQAGPDSAPVTAYYDVVPTQSSALADISFGGPQMLINTDAVYRGSFPNQAVTMPIEIIGGTPPFAVNIRWGDSNNNTVPRSNNIPFNADHKYKKPGTYQIQLQGTDSQQRVAFLTVAAIINGQPDAVAAASQTKAKLNKFIVLWPLYVSAIGIVLAFWLGERREKHVMENSYPYVQAPPGT